MFLLSSREIYISQKGNLQEKGNLDQIFLKDNWSMKIFLEKCFSQTILRIVYKKFEGSV